MLAERIMGQDQKFVMVTQNAGLGMAALGRGRKSLLAYSNFICYISWFFFFTLAGIPEPHLGSTDSTILSATLQGSKLRHKVMTQSIC